MSTRQLLALILCSLVPWTVRNGIAPLLPVRAGGLGASQVAADVCLSPSHLAMAGNTVSAGWLSGRLCRRMLPSLVAGVASTPTTLPRWRQQMGIERGIG